VWRTDPSAGLNNCLADIIDVQKTKGQSLAFSRDSSFRERGLVGDNQVETWP
jgi:hypothetical protein